MNLKEIDIKTVKIEVKMLFFRFALFFEEVKFSTKKTKTVYVYFAINLLQYFRFFCERFCKNEYDKTKSWLSFRFSE